MTLFDIEKAFDDLQLGGFFKAACKDRDIDRIVNMIRVLGAMKNWCAKEDCCICPLAIDGCTVDIERHVHKFLESFEDV